MTDEGNYDKKMKKNCMQQMKSQELIDRKLN